MNCQKKSNLGHKLAQLVWIFGEMVLGNKKNAAKLQQLVGFEKNLKKGYKRIILNFKACWEDSKI